MAESLAYYSSKKGDKYSSFSASELDSLLERLKNGESFSDITSSLKSFNYYKEAYDGVLSQFVGSYQREKSDGSVENTYGLKVFSPVAKGYYYSHSDDFGAGRSFGFKRKHLGHDLMGSIGSPIIAVESGVVSMVGWNMYGGWRVGISSFDGKRYYYYAHLRKDRPYNQNIKIGEVVAAGDVIGYLGATGYSTTENTNGMNVPHLHFGIQLIFDESQREGNREIWIDVYNLTLFLEKNKSTVFKDTESGEYKRKYRFYEDSLRDHGFSAIL
jgi:murein DD-endopeptidase MepM/ murein hydrolase activator NlpD